jgi:hypothetical protein
VTRLSSPAGSARGWRRAGPVPARPRRT